MPLPHLRVPIRNYAMSGYGKAESGRDICEAGILVTG